MPESEAAGILSRTVSRSPVRRPPVRIAQGYVPRSIWGPVGLPCTAVQVRRTRAGADSEPIGPDFAPRGITSPDGISADHRGPAEAKQSAQPTRRLSITPFPHASVCFDGHPFESLDRPIQVRGVAAVRCLVALRTHERCLPPDPRPVRARRARLRVRRRACVVDAIGARNAHERPYGQAGTERFELGRIELGRRDQLVTLDSETNVGGLSTCADGAGPYSRRRAVRSRADRQR